MKEGKFWEKDNGRVHCYLCPRNCRIGDGKSGYCRVRKNISGRLCLLVYGKPTAVHIDPIEKKPLYHFYPGSSSLSIGTAGCNLGCKFCQNSSLSRAHPDEIRSIPLSPEDAVKTAVKNACMSMSYTYNEPTIWAEYLMDIAELAHEQGLKNMMVTNGYISKEVIRTVYKNIDAANVDLKAITEHFYKKHTLSHLYPVLDALVELKSMGVWIEVTNLIIPTLNDSLKEVRKLSKWVYENLGDEVPLHFSAFHPDYRMTRLPRTSAEKLEDARKIAMDEGIKYVYLGNVYSEEGSNTYCPSCGRIVISRSGFSVDLDYLINRACSCGQKIKGCFL